MKKLYLLATALYLGTTATGFAANTLIISQAPVGGNTPVLNFSQGGATNAFGSIIQNGNNTLTGVQLGDGAKFSADQENPTSGAVNTINYTGRGNSNVIIDQRATNGIFSASGSAGNTVTVDMAGNLPGGPANSLFVDQVGFNNNATIFDTFAGSATLGENFNVAQYSDSTVAGNQLQVQSSGVLNSSGQFVQQGGNKANVTINGGVQLVNLQQKNTADNIASANVANMTINNANVDWSQTGTKNDLEAKLTGASTNAGLYGWQAGNGNLATVTQTNAYLDFGGGLSKGANGLYQTGDNNIALATQTNTHNSSFVIQQNGNGNNTTIAQTGTNHVAQVYQINNNNTASITQSGTGASAIVHQN